MGGWGSESVLASVLDRLAGCNYAAMLDFLY